MKKLKKHLNIVSYLAIIVIKYKTIYSYFIVS